MKLDILDFGSHETLARYTMDARESELLMMACAALRDSRFPGVLDKLPGTFDEDDLARVLGNEEDVAELMAIFEAEQVFHQALHLFPGGHAHGHED